MADFHRHPLLLLQGPPLSNVKPPRVSSLDVFRGLCVFLMMLVDYGGSIFPIIAHTPWNGLHLADFVMPFFLFIAGVSLALVYKKVPNQVDATRKAVVRAVKLFLLGVFLQGGYFHGINSLTYGVDIERIRWLGILQRISIGYIAAALCEIWLSRRVQTQREVGFFKNYYLHWIVAFSLTAIYLGLLYGIYVPDWEFEVSNTASSVLPTNGSSVYLVKCSVRGDLGPACNSAAMIDRYILGIDHLYTKPVHRNLKECNMTKGHVSEDSPSWCHAPFDPEGLLSSLTAAITSIIGLQCGHVLAHIQDHKGRIESWSLFSASLLLLGSILAIIGIPVNKSLYTISYMLITSSLAGITFCALYLLVDVYGYRYVTLPLEWIGKHSLSIFILVTSNVAIIAIQGFYLKKPENNIIHSIVSFFIQR
ncbi:uncharacterized protein LOC126682798 [Mercurialis annua]|uniref:uncharacterized protein LOC126682798 n=1 Tax=Mercurialis annua TaxID=3986 RepID=UPI00215DF16C|nr:uncharacterized protein LOC126682798 [Mercurialis annua]